MLIDTLTPRRLVLRDGESDAEEGAPQHAVPLDGKERGPAICGTRPGKRTGWSMYAGISVTCCKCQMVLSNRRP